MSEYTPVTPDHIGKEVELSDNQKNWLRMELVAILPGSDPHGFRYVAADREGYFSLFKYAKTRSHSDYSDRQAKSGLKPGDWVEVTRKAKSFEDGWQGAWMSGQDHYVGHIQRIREDFLGAGFLLEQCHYCFPYFVLKQVSCRPAGPEDLGKVVQYKGQACILENLFEPSKGKITRAVIDLQGSLKIVFQSDVAVLMEDQA